MSFIYECAECEGGIRIQSSTSEDLKCPKCGATLIAEEGSLVRLKVMEESELHGTDTPKEPQSLRTICMSLSVES